jgi:hypothetical protein
MFVGLHHGHDTGVYIEHNLHDPRAGCLFNRFVSFDDDTSVVIDAGRSPFDIGGVKVCDRRLREGIPLPDATWEAICAVARDLGIATG